MPELQTGERAPDRSILTWIFGAIVAILVTLVLSVVAARIMAASPTDIPSWVQAIGTVVTIVSGAAFALWQQGHSAHQKALDAATAAEAAHSLAFEAFTTIASRLDVALAPQKPPTAYNLGGLRTTEMVDAMREVDSARIPASLLSDFIKLRSQIYAINARITDLYARENVHDVMASHDARQRRRRKLASAVRTYREATAVLESLQSGANKQFKVLIRALPQLAHIAAYIPDDVGG